MTTKKKLAEQIQRLIAGNPIISGRIHINDVMLAVEQAANQALKADYFAISTPEGDTIPNNCMVYTYESVPVTTYKTTKSRCALPSFPINLPRNMGVLHVSKTDAIDEPFIPIPTSMYGIIKPQDLLGDLSGLIAYEVVGKDIVFTQNLPGMSVNNVYIRLVGMDMNTLSIYDPLPLSSDMEVLVVQAAYNMLVQVPPADRAKDARD